MTHKTLTPSTGADEDTNPSTNETFAGILETRLSRRQVLRGGVGVGAMTLLGGAGLSACLTTPEADDAPFKLGFKPVPKTTADAVTLPADYHHSVLYRLGDHHDGMHFFCLGADGKWKDNVSDRGLLCINHEAITPAYLHPTGPTIKDGAHVNADEVLREFYVHGVGIVEVAKTNGAWGYQKDSRFNRRIHTLTEMTLSGPAGRRRTWSQNIRATAPRRAARSTTARTAIRPAPGRRHQAGFRSATFGSHWPDGGKSRPRSATIVITKKDGGVIGV